MKQEFASVVIALQHGHVLRVEDDMVALGDPSLCVTRDTIKGMIRDGILQENFQLSPLYRQCPVEKNCQKKAAMSVDTVALLQGVIDALADRKISEEFYERVRYAISSVSHIGPVGRSECRHDELLLALSTIEAEWIEWTMLWKYLGDSLSSGITVAGD